MPIPPDSLPTIEDALNRLATESILAQAGRDEGMVPVFSLLLDLRGLLGPEPAICEPVAAVLARVEKAMDEAAPFTEDLLTALRSLSTWLLVALGDLREGRVPLPLALAAAEPEAPAAPALSSAAVAGAIPADATLVLSLEDNADLLVEFYGEAVEHLQQIEAGLLALEQRPDDPEALNSVFRSFHTIKGNAGFLGLVPVHTLAHEVETLLDLARTGKLAISSAIVTAILRSRDALQALTHQVAAALDKGELPTEVVPVAHLIAAVRALAVAAPVPPAAPPAAKLLDFSAALREPEPVAEPAPAVPGPAASVTTAPMASSVTTAPMGVGATSGGTVRVNTEKLDSLMDVVGELVIVQSQLLETARQQSDGNTTLHRDVAQLSRIAKDLQRTAMSLRMIPLRQTFQKMERLARDLGKELGKKVQFETSGDETELDRTVVEEIADPLVHMVRNALDHGLEPGGMRLAAGKPEAGTIHLRAYHQGSSLVIELRDDGRGIDPERIHRKAVEKGLVPPGSSFTREEILGLIFAPGFSTAEQVTSVSGRGVGMDVVKRNIEKLRGKIEISSELGKGSTFKVRLPLTMAIIDGLVVRVGDDRFILPSSSVQMALRPTRESISTIHGAGEVLDLRGKLLPIHRLHRRFNIAARALSPWEGILVIMETSGKVSALLVDEMVSKQEVVIKNLGGYMQGMPGIAGGAILGDGNIALILDPGTLLEAAA
jgi:two-component system, chemotaxis family, sensor kinase CheA